MKKLFLIVSFVLVSALIGASMEAIAAESLPLVKVLATGGTIAMKFDAAKGGLVPALTGEELMAAVPEIKKIARIEVEDIAKIGGADMNPDIWIKLSKRMNELLADPGVTGVVISQGTDTIEETAYFLDLTLTSQKPAIIVGAQRGPEARDADGPRNLLDAVRVAISPEAIGKGVVVVMNSQINAARDVVKTHTSDVGTFKSPEFGQLGVVDLFGNVRFYRAPLRRQTIPLGDEPKLERVEIVLHFSGSDPRTILGLLNQGDLAGMVLVGTGIGNVSQALFPAVEEVRKRGIPVVVSTSVYTGQVQPIYAAPGRGIPLKRIGCVLADNLSPKKARVLLMLAMTKTKDPEELRKYFEN